MDPVASRRVATSLRSTILAGDLKPGDRILQEAVAAKLGASRLPVREALRMLASEGLVELEPNKGARIPQLTALEVDVIYRMREALEPLALHQSLPNLSAATIDELSVVQDEIEANDTIEGFLELDRRFHMLSYSACTVEPLMGMVRRLWNSTQFYRRNFVAMGGRERMWIVNSEHRLILDAVCRHDALDASTFLGAHISRTRKQIASHPELFDIDS